MKAHLTPDAWLFNIEKAPLYATVTKGGETQHIPVANRIALVDADAGEVVGVVGNDYRLFTNREAIDLCREFCSQAFPDTYPAEWAFRAAHGPESRSWVSMDFSHCSSEIHLGSAFPSEFFAPFVRVTNSYNASPSHYISKPYDNNHTKRVDKSRSRSADHSFRFSTIHSNNCY